VSTIRDRPKLLLPIICEVRILTRTTARAEEEDNRQNQNGKREFHSMAWQRMAQSIRIRSDVARRDRSVILLDG